MTTLKELERIVPEIISQLQEISDKMSRYKNIDTDFRARGLMSEIKDKIEQIHSNMKVFNGNPSLANFDFDEYVAELRNYVIWADSTYHRIKRFENPTEYY